MGVLPAQAVGQLVSQCLSHEVGPGIKKLLHSWGSGLGRGMSVQPGRAAKAGFASCNIKDIFGSKRKS